MLGCLQCDAVEHRRDFLRLLVIETCHNCFFTSATQRPFKQKKKQKQMKEHR